MSDENTVVPSWKALGRMFLYFVILPMAGCFACLAISESDCTRVYLSDGTSYCKEDLDKLR